MRGYILTVEQYKEKFAAMKIQDFWYRRNIFSSVKFHNKLKSAKSNEDKEIKYYRNIVLHVFYRKMEDKLSCSET